MKKDEAFTYEELNNLCRKLEDEVNDLTQLNNHLQTELDSYKESRGEKEPLNEKCCYPEKEADYPADEYHKLEREIFYLKEIIIDQVKEIKELKNKIYWMENK